MTYTPTQPAFMSLPCGPMHYQASMITVAMLHGPWYRDLGWSFYMSSIRCCINNRCQPGKSFMLLGYSYFIQNPYIPCERFGNVNFQMHIPSVWFLDSVYCRGSKYFIQKCPMNLSTWNSHSPCVTCVLNHPHGCITCNRTDRSCFLLYRYFMNF